MVAKEFMQKLGIVNFETSSLLQHSFNQLLLLQHKNIWLIFKIEAKPTF